MRPAITYIIALTSLSLGLCLALPQWKVSVQQGIRLKVPNNWTVTSKGNVITLVDPEDQGSTGMIFTWADKDYASSAATLASNFKKRLDINGVFTQLGQSTEKNILSQLYLYEEDGERYYLSIASFAGDRSKGQGWWVTGFMSNEETFNALGGPMFPFAVLGKVSDQQLSQAIASASKNVPQVQSKPLATSTKGPNSPECTPPPTNDPIADTYKLLTVPDYCHSNPALEGAFAIMQKNMDEAMNNYKKRLIAYNVAWDRYQQAVGAACSSKNAKTVAELQQIQSVCQASLNGTAMSINSWHQTNKGILYNMGNQPWCYADKNGNCK